MSEATPKAKFLTEENALRIENAKSLGWTFKEEGSSEGRYVVFEHPEHGMMRYFVDGTPEDTRDRLDMVGIPRLALEKSEASEPNTHSNSCKVLAQNNTTVSVYGIMLGIAPGSDPSRELVAVLSKGNALELVQTLLAAHALSEHAPKSERD